MTTVNDPSKRRLGNRVADLVVTLLIVVGWCALLWLWLVEYQKRLEVFLYARLKIPWLMQSVMERLPFLVGVAAVLTCIGLWLMWLRRGKWWQSTLLVVIILGL